MSIVALVAELADAGVALTQNGNRLHYQTRPGVSIAPYLSGLTKVMDRSRSTAIDDSDELSIQIRASRNRHPGPKLLSFGLECITAHKPALLAERLKTEILAALDVEPGDFDRLAYLRLMARYDVAETQLTALNIEIL